MPFKKIILFVALIVSTLLFNCTVKKSEQQQKPNILIIYLDDLGYGDVSAYGSVGLQTPNIDKLANGGVKFTDAHSSSSTCTPSRYALLTGVYPWRNKNAKILPGDAALPRTGRGSGDGLAPEGIKTKRLLYWGYWQMAFRLGR